MRTKGELGEAKKEATKEQNMSNIYHFLKHRTKNVISLPHFEMKPDSLGQLNDFQAANDLTSKIITIPYFRK